MSNTTELRTSAKARAVYVGREKVLRTYARTQFARLRMMSIMDENRLVPNPIKHFKIHIQRSTCHFLSVFCRGLRFVILLSLVQQLQTTPTYCKNAFVCLEHDSRGFEGLQSGNRVRLTLTKHSMHHGMDCGRQQWLLYHGNTSIELTQKRKR